MKIVWLHRFEVGDCRRVVDRIVAVAAAAVKVVKVVKVVKETPVLANNSWGVGGETMCHCCYAYSQQHCLPPHSIQIEANLKCHVETTRIQRHW